MSQSINQLCEVYHSVLKNSLVYVFTYNRSVQFSVHLRIKEARLRDSSGCSVSFEHISSPHKPQPKLYLPPFNDPLLPHPSALVYPSLTSPVLPSQAEARVELPQADRSVSVLVAVLGKLLGTASWFQCPAQELA